MSAFRSFSNTTNVLLLPRWKSLSWSWNRCVALWEGERPISSLFFVFGMNLLWHKYEREPRGQKRKKMILPPINLSISLRLLIESRKKILKKFFSRQKMIERHRIRMKQSLSIRYQKAAMNLIVIFLLIVPNQIILVILKKQAKAQVQGLPHQKYQQNRKLIEFLHQ